VSSMNNNSCVNVPKVSGSAAGVAGAGSRRPASGLVRRVYDSWMSVSEDDRLRALEAAVGEEFARRPGKDSPRAQCQDLTLSGSPLQAAHVDVRLLTAEQITSMGAPASSGPPTAVRNSDTWVETAVPARRGRIAARTVTPAGPGGEEESERLRSAPPDTNRTRASSERSRSSRDTSPAPSELVGADQRVDELMRRIAQQDERIRQLFNQQLAELNEDISSAYIVLDEVWHKVGRNATEDRCSWLNINTLKKREVSEIIRMHSG
jgi:hypothetical protein